MRQCRCEISHSPCVLPTAHVGEHRREPPLSSMFVGVALGIVQSDLLGETTVL